MNTHFERQLDEELLRSEKKRTLIVIFVFLAALSIRVINLVLFQRDEDTELILSSLSIFGFPVLLLLFEAGYLYYVNRRIKAGGRRIPLYRQCLNAGAEICFPSFVILYVARHHPSYPVLQSPFVMVYFILIILSTLRLSFVLCFFCGVLASLSYICFAIVLTDRIHSSDVARALLLLGSGLAAGLVARQIRAGMDRSVRESERRMRVENLFGRQLSPEVAGKMLENGGRLESRRMHVAIMFIDIRNFTRFASGRSPEEIVQYQNAFFSIVIQTVGQHRGIVHQFLGDGCMVTFGAPLELGNPARNAVLASEALLQALATAGERGELLTTRIGIGIHTGEVVTGNIGTEERQQYSITGNVVILAARIEQMNKEFDSQLLVSEEVVRSAERQDEAVRLGSFPLKGWHEAVPIFKLA
jgi:adenylate cyclase